MNYLQRILRAVTDVTTRTVGNMIRPGVVQEVKGDKLRMVLGKDNDGKDVLSPWLNTGNHRGGARERRFYKKGQNLMMFAPGGDPRQAVLLPFAPNKDFLAPDHANKSGQDEETYQMDDLRVKKTKEGYDIWLQPPRNKQSSSGDAQKLPEQKSDIDGQAIMKIRLNKDGGITARVGKLVRMMTHKKGTMIWTKDNSGIEHYFCVRQDEKPFLRVSEGAVIWPHRLPLDDK